MSKALYQQSKNKNDCDNMTTLIFQVWNIHNRGLCMDLPGHGDEVYAVDWSPDGTRVASGGKDKLLKLWRQ